MKRYYIKAPLSGWHEVDESGYKSYISFLKVYGAPPGLTMAEYIESRTRVEDDPDSEEIQNG